MCSTTATPLRRDPFPFCSAELLLHQRRRRSSLSLSSSLRSLLFARCCCFLPEFRRSTPKLGGFCRQPPVLSLVGVRRSSFPVLFVPAPREQRHYTLSHFILPSKNLVLNVIRQA
ncbi:hypothetical protein BVRB_1g012880 [Beta vulgaris subsp. vulgaris]|nr:hypothetical protein BVRB_1g012880 [Beta vulgaris subsp. vulgaris]